MRLALLGVVLLFGLMPTSATLADGDETATSAWTKNPVISNNGDSISIGATIPGSDGGTERSGGGSDTTDRTEAGPGTGAAPCSSPLCRPNYSAATIPRPTLSDLASFAPAAPSLATEPAGVGIVGMPSNLVTAAGEHVVTGQLFSLPVTVRFTPVAFTFASGDGGSRSTPTGGRTWAQLGQAQFTPTATSHVYTARGVYAARATVHYAASVDFGTGWSDVPGTLPITSAAQSIQVYEARTALVAHTCRENPAGPGC